MTGADLKQLADIIKDNRSPCERDGHNYTLIGGSSNDVLYCTKCGETKTLPDGKKLGLR